MGKISASHVYISKLKESLDKNKIEFKNTQDVKYKIIYSLIEKAAKMLIDTKKSNKDILKDIERYLKVLVRTSTKHRIAKRLVDDSRVEAKYDAARKAFFEINKLYEEMIPEAYSDPKED